jgi:hypothetical protein
MSTPPSSPGPSCVVPNLLIEPGGLISLADVSRPKRARHSAKLFVPGHEALVSLPGRVNFTQINHSTTDFHANNHLEESQFSIPQSEDLPNSQPFGNDPDLFVPDTDADTANRKDFRCRKRARQHSHWKTEVIPSLVPIHLRLLHLTKCLREPVPYVLPTCTCGMTGRSLNIICVYFDRTFPAG